MGWIKLDDGFLDHPKFLEAGPLAGYLNVCAIAWANRNLTDGFIPSAQVARLVNWEGIAHPEVAGDADALDLAKTLVDLGLWETAFGGFQIHDYLGHQRSAAQIQQLSTTRAESGKRGGQANTKQTEDNGQANGTHPASKRQAEVRSKKEETPTSTPSRPRSAIEEDSSPQVIALCELLASLIVANDPKADPSPQSKTWRDAARLLLTKDGRDADEAAIVIRWCQADEFWRSNILSMSKFREKYPQLLLRMTAVSHGRAETHAEVTRRRLESVQRLGGLHAH